MCVRYYVLRISCVLIITACVSFAQTTPPSSMTNYSDDSSGLRQILEEVMRAADSRDTPKELILVNSLLIPSNSGWFVDTFGPAFGPRLSSAYDISRPQLKDQLRTIFEADVQHGIRVPQIRRYDDPATANAPIDMYLNCMNQISPLYEAALSGERPSIRLGPAPAARGRMRVIGGDLPGFYVYVEGSFRFVPGNVLSLLPKQRPVRIQLDMNIMKSKVIQRVLWAPPKEASKENTKGTVVVHMILDTTGKVKEIGSVEGPRAVADAILPSLKQWTFQPTFLDGDPVEVDLLFEVNLR